MADSCYFLISFVVGAVCFATIMFIYEIWEKK